MRPKMLMLPIVSIVAVLSGCGGGAEPLDELPSPAVISTTSAVTVEPTPTESAGPSVTVTAPTAGAGSGVPDVVGLRLPEAKDRLKAAGYPDVSHVDATGQNRRVVDADNWVVRSQVPSAGSTAVLATPVTLRVGKPSDDAGSASVTVGTVPDVMCKELNAAKSALKEAGFGKLSAKDATGHGRRPLLDRDWVVVSQSVRAGSRPDQLTGVVLGVVKYGEPTGPSGCRS